MKIDFSHNISTSYRHKVPKRNKIYPFIAFIKIRTNIILHAYRQLGNLRLSLYACIEHSIVHNNFDKMSTHFGHIINNSKVTHFS